MYAENLNMLGLEAMELSWTCLRADDLCSVVMVYMAAGLVLEDAMNAMDQKVSLQEVRCGASQYINGSTRPSALTRQPYRP